MQHFGAVDPHPGPHDELGGGVVAGDGAAQLVPVVDVSGGDAGDAHRELVDAAEGLGPQQHAALEHLPAVLDAVAGGRLRLAGGKAVMRDAAGGGPRCEEVAGEDAGAALGRPEDDAALERRHAGGRVAVDREFVARRKAEGAVGAVDVEVAAEDRAVHFVRPGAGRPVDAPAAEVGVRAADDVDLASLRGAEKTGSSDMRWG